MGDFLQGEFQGLQSSNPVVLAPINAHDADADVGAIDADDADADIWQRITVTGW